LSVGARENAPLCTHKRHMYLFCQSRLVHGSHLFLHRFMVSFISKLILEQKKVVPFRNQELLSMTALGHVPILDILKPRRSTNYVQRISFEKLFNLISKWDQKKAIDKAAKKKGIEWRNFCFEKQRRWIDRMCKAALY
jgi:hypothetical protein